MASPADVVSVLVAVEFVVVASAVLLLVPFEKAVALVPLLLVFLYALHRYRS